MNNKLFIIIKDYGNWGIFKKKSLNLIQSDPDPDPDGLKSWIRILHGPDSQPEGIDAKSTILLYMYSHYSVNNQLNN